MDSAMENTTANDNESYNRTVQRELEMLRHALVQMKFTQERATGYSNKPSNEDLVEDVTRTNTDQNYIDRYGYVVNSTFADGRETKAMAEADAYEAALEVLKDADGESPARLASMLDNLFKSYPVLQSMDRRVMSDHPAARLAALYAKSLSEAAVRKQRQPAKEKPLQNFY